MPSAQLYARHWIGGNWIDSAARRNSIDPATGDTIGQYADGGEPEAAQAIAAARQAFLEIDWRENRPRRSTKWPIASRRV